MLGALVLAASLSSIEPGAIKAHVDFLASDVLEGRETGTRGYDVAARYVASQFALAGLARQKFVRDGLAAVKNAYSFFERIRRQEGIARTKELITQLQNLSLAASKPAVQRKR